MKKLYTTLLCALALISTNTNAQVQLLPSCNPPAELLAAYDDEIRMMAFNAAWYLQHPDTGNIQLSQGLYDLVADGMAAIYNSGMPAADSIFNKLCVHNKYGSDFFEKRLHILFNPTHSWTSAWQNGQTITGNTAIDNLFAEHELEVDQSQNIMGSNTVFVKSPKVINVFALENALKQIQGIYRVEYYSFIGVYPESFVSMIPDGNNRNYTFKLVWLEQNTGWGGGLGIYTWKFAVNNNCHVTHLSSSLFRDPNTIPLPAPQNCNLFLSSSENIPEPLIQLFPNPTSGTVHIQTEAPLTNLRLFNATGSCVHQQPNGVELNMSHLPTGLYYFSGTDARGKVHTQRLVKN